MHSHGIWGQVITKSAQNVDFLKKVDTCGDDMVLHYRKS